MTLLRYRIPPYVVVLMKWGDFRGPLTWASGSAELGTAAGAPRGLARAATRWADAFKETRCVQLLTPGSSAGSASDMADSGASRTSSIRGAIVILEYEFSL